MTSITPRWKISKKEALKSIRDAILILAWALVPEIIKILEITDFWEYQLAVTIILAAFAPMLNRYLNIIRIK